MQNIQQIFDRIQEHKQKQKDIKAAYKDALESSGEYREIKDELKQLRERKKQIENTIKEQFSSEFTKLEDLKIDIESDNELLSDIAVTKMMKGEAIEIKDKNGNEYEPRFTVKFKKMV
ncbi:MAG: hypothetical protein GF349_04730 [Candidatus Magasanikbacteria bacterium]|nr:hypothetical protein [Candidatus Magasanikbacteria bacterium]